MTCGYPTNWKELARWIVSSKVQRGIVSGLVGEEICHARFRDRLRASVRWRGQSAGTLRGIRSG